MKAVCLVSSGIDSPVAAYLISHYVDELIMLHVDTGSFSDGDQSTTFFSLADRIKGIVTCNLQLGVIPHEESLRAFHDRTEVKYTCVFCKRMMVRYADRIAQIKGADMIVMGDSLGQVASQTLQNIRVVDSVSQVPIIRPLIGLDKQDIIEIAKKIGTFEASIGDTGHCLAVPNKPSTRARNEILEGLEKVIDVASLVDHAVSRVVWKDLGGQF